MAGLDRQLAAMLDDAWARLASGVTDRRSPCHTPTLATLGADGAPASRTVVLRGCDAARWELAVHSDIRSPKWAELRRSPTVGVHVYDGAAKLQLRGGGHAALHTGDALAAARWQASRMISRACYAQGEAPGTPLSAPLPAPTANQAGEVNFGVIVIKLRWLDVLQLRASGHLRARFERDGGASWLAP